MSSSAQGSLVLIGLGLGDLKDITIRGLEEIRSSDYVFLEHYTAILPNCGIEDMEVYYDKKPIIFVGNKGYKSVKLSGAPADVNVLANKTVKGK